MIKGNLKIRIPNPHGRDIGTGLLMEILRQAGISIEDLGENLTHRFLLTYSTVYQAALIASTRHRPWIDHYTDHLQGWIRDDGCPPRAGCRI